ncbi:MAG: serine hydroxymethyltransferase [Actinobacteria bacterium RBG_16_64_13]|nr:MAG: serine hydroxymethyltransferase [Actinobacteria bacterium RBG_16_64_13]
MPLRDVDPAVSGLISQELARQRQNIELIASENFTSAAVLEAVGSVLTNKYAEGYPGERYYGGCAVVDQVEALAIERAKALYGAEHANVQPHSGSTANQAVYFASLRPGDPVLAMSLAHGGHLTHGLSVNFSGRGYRFFHYGIKRETGWMDLDEVRAQALKHRPRLIVVGASAYPRTLDFAAFRSIADEVGAELMADMAHIAGLVAGGAHPSPVPHCDWVTTTTHKTLSGPRGGACFCRAENAARLDKAVFPGLQGGPLEHVIAGKAVCFLLATTDEFKQKQRLTVDNAAVLAETLLEGGLKLVSGGTDNHLLLVDFTGTEMTGRHAQDLLKRVGITANKNAVPYDDRSPTVTSGLRLGTPAMTTRGFRADEMREVGRIIVEALTDAPTEADLDRLLTRSRALTAAFPLYPFLGD